jgi:CheY-like chemotaxis protein
MQLRILVIEDNAQSRELMSYLLKAFGHVPLTANDGVEGLEIAAREQPDLVICDIDLPRMNGCQVARALQDDDTLNPIPRVAVTALAMMGDRDTILASGFDGYIAKPLEPETFVQQIEEFVAGRRHPRCKSGDLTPGPAQVR